ncbi:MAG TPA: sulfatase [Chloroflexota bacterium]|nr:sulfatase [Chloroflexota bacterium]
MRYGGIHNVMNVIVIMNDSLRRDHIAAYGDPAPWSRLGRPPGEPFIRTPNLDRLAGESAVFDRFYVSSYPTIPCRTDIFTGRYSFPRRPWQPLEPGDVVLPELVRRAGLTPVLFFDTPPLGNDDGNFTRGFAGWQWIRGQHADRWNVDPVDPPLPAAPHKLKGTPQTKLYLRNAATREYERDWMCARTLTATMDWLERNRNRGRERGVSGSSQNQSSPGFVLYVDMWDPHEPFDAPDFDVERYADPSFTGDQVIYPQYGRPDYLSPDEHNHVRALYASLVTLSDRWLGHLLDRLDVLGMTENTLLIHLTDHGHLFGEHQLQGKPGGPLGNLYEPTIHIPLMIRHPHGAGAGTRVQGLAQHVDLLPTVLDFLGAPVPDDVEGHSLLPLIRGDQAQVREHAFSGRYPNELARELGEGRGGLMAVAQFDGAAGGTATGTVSSRLIEALTVTTEEWALVCSPRGRPSELYDLRVDLKQDHNVIASQPEVARQLHGALLAFLEKSGASEARIAPFRGDPLTSGDAPEPPAMDDESALYVFEDTRGTPIAFRDERVAQTHAAGAGAGVSEVRMTTFGALRRENPKALLHSPTQYAWLEDLV